MLQESLGGEAVLEVTRNELIVKLPKSEPADRLSGRLDDLSGRIRAEIRRSNRYGLHALKSYKPSDPQRPTLVLVHGINSSSASFMHMIEPLEEKGFGLIVYEFPFNRDLTESVSTFERDWKEMRKLNKETERWSIVTHSMGGLIARGYVEGDHFAGDVRDLVLIGPPNQGSAVAKAQTLLQLIEGMQSVKEQAGGGALAHLSEGLGEAADDLSPGSPFLKALNARPRRAGVSYHILAGDAGFLTPELRGRVEGQYTAISRGAGLIGNMARFALRDLPAQLDELTYGFGDGCVSVKSTVLEGVADHKTIHANHVELIRGPLLYPDPGPVAGMPFILESLNGTPRPK
jgi:pimeloyl-ACP methyl ester carboxylesterase